MRFDQIYKLGEIVLAKFGDEFLPAKVDYLFVEENDDGSVRLDVRVIIKADPVGCYPVKLVNFKKASLLDKIKYYFQLYHKKTQRFLKRKLGK